MRTTILILLTLAMLPLTVAAQGVGAKVYIEETTFDFGFIPRSGTVTHAYYMFSRGTDSLRILKVKPT